MTLYEFLNTKISCFCSPLKLCVYELTEDFETKELYSTYVYKDLMLFAAECTVLYIDETACLSFGYGEVVFWVHRVEE